MRTTKYIDAVSAAELIAGKMGVHLCDMVDMMADVPAADVAEVVHGEWIPIIDEYSMYLNAAHDCYHKRLHGNGDLDALMSDVNELPVIYPSSETRPCNRAS